MSSDHFFTDFDYTRFARALTDAFAEKPKQGMAEIFNETCRAGGYATAYCRRGGTYLGERRPDEVVRNHYTITVETVSHYDAALGVLHVECRMAGLDWDSEPWWIHPEVTLERIDTNNVARAIRRTIEVADDYIARAKAAIPAPDTRGDEQVIAEARAEEEEEIAY